MRTAQVREGFKGVTPRQGQHPCWGWGKAVDSYFCIIIKEGIACL